MPKTNKIKHVKQNKKINKYKNRTRKIQQPLYKNKRGGFIAWSDISNWRPDFTSWKDKLRNFSIFKKKNQQPPTVEQPQSPTVEQPQSPTVEQSPPTPTFEQLPSPTFEQPSQPPISEQLTFEQPIKEQNGGYRGHHSLTNLASKSAPFWQPTAKPQAWVGGKTKYKKYSYKKSKKSKKIH
jgi:hypothetical protein